MAKSRKRQSATRRDASVVANDPGSLLASFDPLRSGRDLQVIEDRRRFTPARSKLFTPRQVARVFMTMPGRRRLSKPPKKFGPEVPAFVLPRSTVVCVRRAIRKQVIHAKGVAGRKVRRPKRNAVSRISCRRK